MDNYVNWGDWYSMQKDSVAEQIAKQQAEAEAQARADDERLTALQGQYETDYRNGKQKQVTSYSDFLALEQEAKSRDAAAARGRDSRFSAGFGLQGPQGGASLSSGLGKLTGDAQAYGARQDAYRTAAAAAEADRMRSYREKQDSMRQARDADEKRRQDLIRQGQLVSQRREAWDKAQAGKFGGYDGQGFKDWYGGTTNWGSAWYNTPAYSSGLSTEDRRLLDQYDSSNDAWSDWYRTSDRSRR